jgi:hypothetical protein
MVSPALMAGFAVIDASVVGQFVYAICSYERHHRDDGDAPPRR